MFRALTVVIPTRDRPGQLAACLDALAADLDARDEVVVVDSASHDRAGVAAVALAAGVRLVRCDLKGASRARNAGWRAASHQDVVFVDDDMRVHPGWSAVLRASDTPFAAGRTVAAGGDLGAVGSVTWQRPDEVIDRSTRGAVAASNNLLVRRAVLEQCGGFDERLGPGTWLEAGEDVELVDRFLAAGHVGRYLHEAVASHEQWRTAAEHRRLQLAYGKGNGARLAALLHRDRPRARLLAPELLRLGGLRTVVQRVAPDHDVAPSVGASTGWQGPLLWRLGGVVGLVVGLVVLRTPPTA